MAGVRLLRSCALPLPVGAARVGLALSALGLLLTVGLTAWAVRAETLLVRANRLALGITATGHPNDPRLAASRREVIRLVREGMALHPHYRKLTPQVADELARWGDWPDAAWVWEGMLASRPHVGALLTNAARARAMQGDLRGAWALYKRARTLQPDAPGVRSLEVNLLMREGREAEALDRVRVALADGRLSRELLVNGQTLAQRAGDEVLAERLRARLARDQMSSSRR